MLLLGASSLEQLLTRLLQTLRVERLERLVDQPFERGRERPKRALLARLKLEVAVVVFPTMQEFEENEGLISL